MAEMEVPDEWLADPRMVWALMDSQRQNEDIRKVTGELAALKDKIENKQKQDLDAAHCKIRDLQTELDNFRESSKKHFEIISILKKPTSKRNLAITGGMTTAVVTLAETILYLVRHAH